MSSLDTVLIKAKGAARRGDTQGARAMIAQVLERFPGNARALAAMKALDAPPRESSVKTDTASGPTPAQIDFDRMVAAFRKGDMTTAATIGQRLSRDHPRVHGIDNMLGAALLELGNDAGAERAFRRAVDADPGPPSSYNNLAIALRRQGKVQEAEATYRTVMVRAPAYADAPYNLANMLETQGRDTDAEAAFRVAITADPAHVDAHYNLGNLMAKLGRHEDAVASLAEAARLRPGHSDAHNNLGAQFMAAERTDDALAAYDAALAADPTNGKALINRGKALVLKGAIPDAVASFRAAVELDPLDKSARLQALFEEAHLCDWSRRNEYPLTDGPEAAAVQPFASLPFVDDPAHQLRRSRACAAQMYPAKPRSWPQPPPAADGRIRIGYFSADFHDHATMHLMAGFFRHHDASRFDIRLYSYGPDRAADAARRSLVAEGHIFQDIRDLRDEEAVALARSDGLDIAVDLKGYTMGTRTRLFGHRLAPLQVSWMGYPGTLGHPCMDYFLADEVTVPHGTERFFSEKIVRLAHCYQANDDTRPIMPDPRSRSDRGLPSQGIVFASFNQCYKITPHEWDIWMMLLREVEGSVLWLLTTNPWAEGNLRREAQLRSVDPGRLVFATPLPHAEHLGRLQHADLFLDTFAVNAHTTASDALWAGLPLLTLAGWQFCARVAASLLHAIGLPELVTRTEESYAATALQLATQPDRLTTLRDRLAVNRRTTPLFDTAAYTARVERAFEEMHRRQRAGLSPDHFAMA